MKNINSSGNLNILNLDISDIQVGNRYSKISYSLDKVFRGQSIEELQKKVKSKIYFKETTFLEKAKLKDLNKHKKMYNIVYIRSNKTTMLPTITINHKNEQNSEIEKIKKKRRRFEK